MKKIVIFGGAFNPPHIGHAKMIEAVVNNIRADEVWVMPSAERHDKKLPVSGEDRLKMAELTVSEFLPNPKIPVRVSDMEIARQKPTVTYETKTELEKTYPGYEFYFVVGSDSLLNMEEKWINGKKLFQEGHFIVVERPSYKLPERMPPHLLLVHEPVSHRDISSTVVRDLLKKGESVEGFLAKGVIEYIRGHNLYR